MIIAERTFFLALVGEITAPGQHEWKLLLEWNFSHTISTILCRVRWWDGLVRLGWLELLLESLVGTFFRLVHFFFLVHFWIVFLLLLMLLLAMLLLLMLLLLLLLGAAEDGEVDIAGEKRRSTFKSLDALDALSAVVELQFSSAACNLKLVVNLFGELDVRVVASKIVDVVGAKYAFTNSTGCQSVDIVARTVLVTVVAAGDAHGELGWWLDARMLGGAVSLEGLEGAVDISSTGLHVASEVWRQCHVKVDVHFFEGIVLEHLVVHVERISLRLGSHL
jgi:hypothetical protein